MRAREKETGALFGVCRRKIDFPAGHFGMVVYVNCKSLNRDRERTIFIHFRSSCREIAANLFYKNSSNISLFNILFCLVIYLRNKCDWLV